MIGGDGRVASCSLTTAAAQDELARAAAVPMRLHRRYLERLMLERVEAVLVADEELQRRENGGETDGHADHGAAMLQMRAREPVRIHITQSVAT